MSGSLPASSARRSIAARLAAGLIAAIAVAGIGLFLRADIEKSGSVVAAAGVLLSFFTIWTNILVAALFATIAAGGKARPRTVAALTLAIGLVGVVYAALLNGQVIFTGGSAVADVLLHKLTPILAPLFWLAFTPKGRLTWTDPLLFALYPLAYSAFAMTRGATTGFYAYPFIDAGRLGWPMALTNAAIIAAGFLAVGFALVALDRALGARDRRAS